MALALPLATFAAESVVLGGSIALAGPAPLGADESRALDPAVKEVNAGGGIHGHPLGINLLDGGGDPQRDAFNVRAFLTSDRADAEQFARADTNMNAQATKLAAAHQIAVLVRAISPGANVAREGLLDAGHESLIEQNSGGANETFLRLGGANLDGRRFPAGIFCAICGIARIAAHSAPFRIRRHSGCGELPFGQRHPRLEET